jgi:hypothetical protein
MLGSNSFGVHSEKTRDAKIEKGKEEKKKRGEGRKKVRTQVAWRDKHACQ